mmetsp:Transcript_24780/g.60876  ORF Transcript_24780/g.60876 Transcript_24780/m.60876 type:complete len:147 (-) Transcript_24780:1239-1679(-)
MQYASMECSLIGVTSRHVGRDDDDWHGCDAMRCDEMEFHHDNQYSPSQYSWSAVDKSFYSQNHSSRFFRFTFSLPCLELTKDAKSAMAMSQYLLYLNWYKTNIEKSNRLGKSTLLVVSDQELYYFESTTATTTVSLLRLFIITSHR